MEKEVFEVQLKARRLPRFKAGSDLAKKVNRVIIDVDQEVSEDEEVVSVNLKWISSDEEDECMED